MSGQCHKPKGKAYQLKVRYLFSGHYRDGELVEGSVKPLANQLLAVVVDKPCIEPKDAEGKPSTESKKTERITTLWSSNAQGFLDRLNHRFELAGCAGLPSSPHDYSLRRVTESNPRMKACQ